MSHKGRRHNLTIHLQGFEQLLSSSNDLNRKLEDALGMTREYDNIAELWHSFHQLMRGQAANATTASDAQVPGTGGHTVKNK